MNLEIQPFNPQAAMAGQARFNRDDLWESGSSSGARISTNKGGFTASIDGETVGVRQPTINGIIVGQFPAGRKMYRVFYAGIYDPESARAPDCHSADGVFPDVNSARPQATTCEGCPQNQKGSGQMSNTRACRFGKNLAIVIPEAGDTVFTMRLSSQGCLAKHDPSSNTYGLFAYDAALGKLAPQEVLTTFSQPEGSTGGVRMSPMGVLNMEQAQILIDISRRPSTIEGLKQGFSGAAATGPALAAPSPMQALPQVTPAWPTVASQPATQGYYVPPAPPYGVPAGPEITFAANPQPQQVNAPPSQLPQVAHNSPAGQYLAQHQVEIPPAPAQAPVQMAQVPQPKPQAPMAPTTKDKDYTSRLAAAFS